MTNVTDGQVTLASYIGAAMVAGGAFAISQGYYKTGISLAVSGIGLPLFFGKLCHDRGPVRFLEDAPDEERRVAALRQMKVNELKQIADTGWSKEWLTQEVTDQQFREFFLEEYGCAELWGWLSAKEGRESKQRLIIEQFDDLQPLYKELKDLRSEALIPLFRGQWAKAGVLDVSQLFSLRHSMRNNPLDMIEMRMQTKNLQWSLGVVPSEQNIRDAVKAALRDCKELAWEKWQTFNTELRPCPLLPKWFFDPRIAPYLLVEEYWFKDIGAMVVLKIAAKVDEPNMDTVMKTVDHLCSNSDRSRAEWNPVKHEALLTVGLELWKSLSDEQQKRCQELLEDSIKKGALEVDMRDENELTRVNSVRKLFGLKELEPPARVGSTQWYMERIKELHENDKKSKSSIDN